MFSDPAFREQLEDLLAAARWGAADPDALLGTAPRVPDGDRDAWLREWTSAGGDAWVAGAYLRAAACYGAAFALIGGTDGSVAEHDLWGRQLACWDRASAASFPRCTLGRRRVPRHARSGTSG